MRESTHADTQAASRELQVALREPPLSYIATSDPRIPAKLSHWPAATMMCEHVNVSGARAMAIPKTVGTPMRSAKHGHSMYVSVGLSETPPTAIVPYKVPEEKARHAEEVGAARNVVPAHHCCKGYGAREGTEGEVAGEGEGYGA